MDNGTVYSVVVTCVANEDSGGVPASSMSLVTKGAFSEPTLSVKDYIHSAPSRSGVKITRTINFKTENDKDGFSSGPAFLPLQTPPIHASALSSVQPSAQPLAQPAAQPLALLPAAQPLALLPAAQSAVQLPAHFVTPPPLPPPPQQPEAQFSLVQPPIQPPPSPTLSVLGTMST